MLCCALEMLNLMTRRVPMAQVARLSSSTSSTSLTVHGHYISQPARSVLWLLKIQDEVRYALEDLFIQCFRLISFVVISHSSLSMWPLWLGRRKHQNTKRNFRLDRSQRSKMATSAWSVFNFVNMSFLLHQSFYSVLSCLSHECVIIFVFGLQSEGSAMMQYLCDKHGWDQWWPQGSDETSRLKRAKLSEYLSYHHHGTRMISHKIAFKLFTKQFFKKDYPETKDELREISTKIISNFEKKGLRGGPFIAGSTTPTIADLFAYTEIYQLVYLNVLTHDDLSPPMRAWAEALQALPAHDDVHASLKKLATAMKEEE